MKRQQRFHSHVVRKSLAWASRFENPPRPSPNFLAGLSDPDKDVIQRFSEVGVQTIPGREWIIVGELVHIRANRAGKALKFVTSGGEIEIAAHNIGDLAVTGMFNPGDQFGQLA